MGLPVHIRTRAGWNQYDAFNPTSISIHSNGLERNIVRNSSIDVEFSSFYKKVNFLISQIACAPLLNAHPWWLTENVGRYVNKCLSPVYSPLKNSPNNSPFDSRIPPWALLKKKANPFYIDWSYSAMPSRRGAAGAAILGSWELG